MHHVGSTSIPGMIAKPIIDLDISVINDAALRRTVAQLERGVHAMRAPAGPIQHHLYICLHDNDELRRHLQFRDFLRQHPSAANDYAALKQVAAKKHRDDRTQYSADKSKFIEDTLLRSSLQMKSSEVSS